jgi:hypothetical protein
MISVFDERCLSVLHRVKSPHPSRLVWLYDLVEADDSSKMETIYLKKALLLCATGRLILPPFTHHFKQGIG